MRISELQAKDVINIVDGKKLGHVMDVEFDLQNGRIEALMIPHSARFFGWLGGGSEWVLGWRNIVKIGADVILVRLEEQQAMEQGYDEATMAPIKPLRTM